MTIGRPLNSQEQRDQDMMKCRRKSRCHDEADVEADHRRHHTDDEMDDGHMSCDDTALICPPAMSITLQSVDESFASASTSSIAVSPVRSPPIEELSLQTYMLQNTESLFSLEPSL